MEFGRRSRALVFGPRRFGHLPSLALIGMESSGGLADILGEFRNLQISGGKTSQKKHPINTPTVSSWWFLRLDLSVFFFRSRHSKLAFFWNSQKQSGKAKLTKLQTL